MAETETETETKAISVNEEQKKLGPFAPLFSLFSNIHINLPQFKRGEPKEEVVQKVGEEPKAEKPVVVRVPDSRRDFPVLKLENEEAGESGGRNMWQVYALGGFMLMRWAWAKWQEKKANEKQSDKKEIEDVDDGDQEPDSPEYD